MRLSDIHRKCAYISYWYRPLIDSDFIITHEMGVINKYLKNIKEEIVPINEIGVETLCLSRIFQLLR